MIERVAAVEAIEKVEARMARGKPEPGEFHPDYPQIMLGLALAHALLALESRLHELQKTLDPDRGG